MKRFTRIQVAKRGLCLLSLGLLSLGLGAWSGTTCQAQDWPQWMGLERQGTFHSDSQVTEFKDGDLKEAWSVPVKMGYAGPTVANGRVFLMDWELTPEQQKAKEPGTERVLCFDESTGEVLWEKAYPKVYRISYPFGPRTTCAVEGERVYALGAMGNLWCLNVEDGSEIWSIDFLDGFAEKPPFWGFAAHPFIDGDQLICVVGGEGSALVSFDKLTGDVLWKSHRFEYEMHFVIVLNLFT